MATLKSQVGDNRPWKDHIYIVRRAQLGTHQAASFGLNGEYPPALVAYCDVPVSGRSKKVIFVKRVFQS